MLHCNASSIVLQTVYYYCYWIACLQISKGFFSKNVVKYYCSSNKEYQWLKLMDNYCRRRKCIGNLLLHHKMGRNETIDSQIYHNIVALGHQFGFYIQIPIVQPCRVYKRHFVSCWDMVTFWRNTNWTFRSDTLESRHFPFTDLALTKYSLT